MEGVNYSTEEESFDNQYWQKWLKASKRAAKGHWLDSAAAWQEFVYDVDPTSMNDSWDYSSQFAQRASSYPIYYSTIQTIEPALYSRTPDTYTTRKFDINDPIALTMSKIAERLGAFHLASSNFDATMEAAVLDFLNSAKATNQVIYEAALKAKKVKAPLIQSIDPVTGVESYFTQEGNTYTEEVFQDENGFYGEIEEQELDEDSQKIILAPVCFDEILHTPEAKTEHEIKAKAFKFYMTEAECKGRFSPELCQLLPWKTGIQEKYNYGVTQGKSPLPLADKYIEGWEIWCKKTRKVYWVVEDFAQTLDIKDDPYQLEGFYPSPKFILNGKPQKSLYPTPPYIHFAPTLKQLHKMYFKVFGLIEAVRRRALIDGSISELVSLLQELGDNEFIAVKNLQQIVEKGGLNNLVWYLPVSDLVAAISELNALDEKFKNNFYEWFGLPDILRGVSEPIEGVATNELKAQAGNDRFKNVKKKIAQLARDSLEMMIDLSLRVFSDQKIMQITGYQYMSPEDQMRFPEALAALRNDTERLIRIDIDTDSLSFIDQNIKQQRRNVAVQTAMEGLKQVAEMLKISPDFANVAMQTVLLSLDGMEFGREFEDGVKRAVSQLAIQMANPPEQPPAPDYESMKIELQQQKLEIESAKVQLKSQEVAQAANESARDAAIEQFKLEASTRLEERIQTFIEWAETQRIEIERIKTGLIDREKLIEEQRLKSEQELEKMRIVFESQKPQEHQLPQMPVLHINVDASKRGTRVGRITVDETGQPMIIQEDMPQV